MKEFLESGMLELYVAGLLDANERAEVEAMLLKYPELRKELQEMESSLEGYAQANAVRPKEDVRERVLSKVFEKADVPVLSIWTNPTVRYAIAASIALVLVMGVALLTVFTNYKQQETLISLLKDQNAVLQHEISQVATKVSMLESIRKPQTCKVLLAGLEKYPNADAVVYWDNESKMVTIDCIHLPGTDKEHQYQLWALVNGKPVDAGVFQEQDSFRQLKKVDAAQAFAVTLEPMGGSVNPTMDKMYLYTQL